VASQSARIADLESPGIRDDLRSYLAGWSALTRLMAQGTSWSGRERNNAFLNLRDGTFADASALLGLDFKDDGRAVAATDWDGDGDLDLWLRNRTGPQLRLMRNEIASGHWIAFELTGVTSNRDAVGARVAVVAGDRRHVRTVTSGSGYLAQSSRRLHFGLGDATKIDSITVTWPSGSSDLIPPPDIDALYKLREGSRTTEQVAPPATKLGDAISPPPRPMEAGAIALRTPLPLPPSISSKISELSPTPTATVINLWSLTCPPCFGELSDWARNRAALEKAGIEVLAFNVDPDSDQERAQRKFKELVGDAFPNRRAGALGDTLTTLVRHVRQLGDVDLTLPTSLLVDKAGKVDIVYLGTTTAARLIHHKKLFDGFRPHERSLRGGRWFFSVPRDWKSLADLVPDATDAAFYRTLK